MPAEQLGLGRIGPGGPPGKRKGLRPVGRPVMLGPSLAAEIHMTIQQERRERVEAARLALLAALVCHPRRGARAQKLYKALGLVEETQELSGDKRRLDRHPPPGR